MFYGQHNEDAYIKTFFPDNYTGVCVDVGAYDGKSGSNTYYFEERGWRCLCIEPILESFIACRNCRKECVNCACGEHNQENASFTIFCLEGQNLSAISSLSPDQRLIDSHNHLITKREGVLLQVKTLTTLLDERNYPTNIDFISIDTENTELDVLKGLDLNKYNVKLLVIENNFNEPQIEEYLKKFNYKKVNRLAVNDFYTK